MELFHTSPAKITEIHRGGRFGEFLFFSGEAYVMTAGEHVTYRLDVNEDQIIEASDLFYHDDAEKLQGLVQEVVEMVGCDEDTAEELIAQREDVHGIDSDIDPDELGEVSWNIQALTARAAKILGFRGVTMQDEQGACYMIDMLPMDMVEV